MLKVIIIDDEKKSREVLKNLLNEYCADVRVEGMASNAEDGLSLIQNVKPDVVFLDIEMQSSTGFDLLKKVDKLNFEVIFTTAYEQYALKAIKFSALDYLLKPIDPDELQTAIERYKQKHSKEKDNEKIVQLLQNIKNNLPQKITLSTSEGLIFIEVDKITRCEAQGAYTVFYLKDKSKIMVSKNLKEYEIILSDQNFFRIHNSHLINMKEVQKFIKSDGGIVVMKDGSNLAISQSRKEKFLELMKLS